MFTNIQKPWELVEIIRGFLIILLYAQTVPVELAHFFQRIDTAFPDGLRIILQCLGIVRPDPDAVMVIPADVVQRFGVSGFHRFLIILCCLREVLLHAGTVGVYIRF